MKSTRNSLVRLLAASALAFSASGCVSDNVNRGVESIHQPVVSYTAYTFDVRTAPEGLSGYEAQRLGDWLASINLGYGDQVAIATDGGYYGPEVRESVANVVARHGLLVGEDSSATAGAAPEGTVRLIVRRAVASVPGCPDWSRNQETDIQLSVSSNFGCGTNSNLAAMIANPEDLVRGQTTDSDLRTATSNRAISTYREKTPTGAGELRQASVTGGK